MTWFRIAISIAARAVLCTRRS